MPDPVADRRCSRGTRRPATRSRDWSSYARDGLFGGGAAAYLATGPTGTSADISGPRYLRTPATTLGFLREATWAADVKINAGTTYRRVWDWKTASGGDDVGFLIDLTPTGQVRIITSGARRHHQRRPADRALHQPGHHRGPRRQPRRLRRRRAASAAARCPTSASTAARRPSCASAPTRAAASASAPSSTARRCSPRCSAPTDRARWQSLAFVDAASHAQVPIGGTVPQVLALTLVERDARASARSPRA